MEDTPGPISTVRGRWFDATPHGKQGVTERYVVYGESRRWLLGQLNLKNTDFVLDLGSGHGFLAYELASRAGSKIVGLDLLGGEQMGTAARGGILAGLSKAIDWVVGDASKAPFSAVTFDTIVSFLGLEDVHITGGVGAMDKVILESARVLKSDGTLAIADNTFPECASNAGQRLYLEILRKELGAQLPSKSFLIETMEGSGFEDIETATYDPKIILDEREAHIELSDIAEAEPFGKHLDIEEIWERYGDRIRKSGLEYPLILLLSARKSS